MSLTLENQGPSSQESGAVPDTSEGFCSAVCRLPLSPCESLSGRGAAAAASVSLPDHTVVTCPFPLCPVHPPLLTLHFFGNGGGEPA